MSRVVRIITAFALGILAMYLIVYFWGDPTGVPGYHK